MQTSKLLLLAIALLSLHGCSRGGREELATADSATFLPDPVTGEAEDAAATGAFDLPKERLINFKACLKDVAVQQSVVGTPFRVLKGSQELVLRSPKSDQAGCLYWSENFAFDATRKETFYEVERTIEATAQHQGKVSVRIGINPWRKGAAAVRDLNTQGAPDSRRVEQADPAAKDESLGLLIEAVETNFDVRGGISAELRLSFEPKLRRLDLAGTPVNQAFTRGAFRVTAQVFAVTPEGTVAFTNQLVTEKATLAQSNVRVAGNVSILRKIRREATLELAFRAEPLGTESNLKPVQGRVPLGRLTGLSLSTKRELVADKSAAANEEGGVPLSAGAGDPHPVTTAPAESEAPLAAGFELGRVSVKEVVVKELDQSGRPKLLEVEFRAVVRNSVTPEPILDQPFRIREGDRKLVEKSDDEDGSLRWKLSYDFDFYKKQEPEKHTFEIQGGKYFGNAKVSRTVYLNLWEYESPGAVAIDEEKDGVPTPSVVSAQGTGAELTLASVMTTFTSRTFEVDSLLNLSTVRKYRFEIAPEIRRLSRNKGWLPPVGLGNGRFRVRFLLETLDPENPQVIDAVEQEAESRNGKIVMEVPFRINDLRQVSVRSRATFQVLPLDERTSLVSVPHAGVFEFLNGFAIRLEPRKTDIGPRMLLAPKKPAAGVANGAEIFARAKNLEFLSADRLRALGLSDADLNRFADTGFQSAVGKLCGLFYPESSYNPFSQYKRCVRDPSGWVVMANTQHVRRLLGAKMQGAPESTSIGISAGLNFSDGESTSEGTSRSSSVGWDVGAKGTVPGLSLAGIDIGIGVSVGQSWSTSTSWSRSKGKGTSRGYDEGKSLGVDEVKFALEAEVDRCTVVSPPKPAVDAKRYFFCAPRAEKKKFVESYFNIAQVGRTSAVQDEGAAITERPLLALIRGPSRYNQFKTVLQDPELSLNLTKSLPVPSDIYKQAEQRFDGFFPGLLTP